MTMTRRRLLDDTFKKTVEGNPAIATDSLARMYPGIVMNGWTEQEETTGAQLLDETIIEQGMLSYGLNGNGEEITSQIMCRSDFIPIKPNEQYYFSGEYANYIGFYNADKEYINSTGLMSFQTPENALYVRLRWYSNGENLTPDQVKKGKPMLNAGSTTLPWEPYTGGQPSPSPEYPQEIVSAGDYNQETGKWEYEVEIANAQTDATENQTVTLTADRPLTKWDKLEKRNGQWGWVYKSAEIESYTDEIVPGEYYSTTGQLSAGAQVWYETATETFVPLTTAEQEAMNALHTFRPATVLSNQQDCDMTLTYKTRKEMS